MKRKRLVGLLVGITLLATLGFGASPASARPEFGIKIKLFTFHPNYMEVPPGAEVVVWNVDGDTHRVPHSVTARDGSFDTGVFVRGTRKFRAPSTPGDYKYFCEVHPFMRGLLRVVR